jgi:hypothetical protein
MRVKNKQNPIPLLPSVCALHTIVHGVFEPQGLPLAWGEVNAHFIAHVVLVIPIGQRKNRRGRGKIFHQGLGGWGSVAMVVDSVDHNLNMLAPRFKTPDA